VSQIVWSTEAAIFNSYRQLTFLAIILYHTQYIIICYLDTSNFGLFKIKVKRETVRHTSKLGGSGTKPKGWETLIRIIISQYGGDRLDG